MTLLEATRKLLAKSQLSSKEIADQCGEPVSYEWLRKFRRDYKSDPTIGRVQALHDFLESRKTSRTRGVDRAAHPNN